MTQTAPEQASTAQHNGKPAAAPAADGEAPCADCTPVSERLMGMLGLLFAAALGVIALDLLTGGWVSRMAGRITSSGDQAQ